MNDDSAEPKIFRVLSLDGGGAKGFYTLGVLKEIEALVQTRHSSALFFIGPAKTRSAVVRDAASRLLCE